MKLREILSEEEVNEYHKEWEAFSQKYVPETSYNTQSKLPVIGKVFQFKDKPIFRAHIFKNRIKQNFNPYNPKEPPYPHANFHLTHYLYPIEQIGHAGLSKLVKDYHRFIVTEWFSNKICPEMKEKIHFDKSHPSIEFVMNVKEGKNRFIGKASAVFYEDTNNKILQAWYIEGIGQLRAYAESIEKLKQDRNDLKEREELIKKIDIRHKKRKNILSLRAELPDRTILIEQIRQGQIPEKELHNYFSDWDK